MDDKLQGLVNLNSEYIEKVKLEKIIREYPEKLIKLDEEKEEIKKTLEGQKQKVKDLEVAANKFELNVKALESDIQKKQSQLFSVKTNKEYTALEKEISQNKTKISQTEEDILKCMDQVEAEREKLKSFMETVDQKIAELDSKKSEMEKSLEEAKANINQIDEKVNELKKKVDIRYLRQFELVASKGFDVPLVTCNEGMCSGCQAVLPPRIRQVVQNGLTLVSCETCSRLLYWDETQE